MVKTEETITIERCYIHDITFRSDEECLFCLDPACAHDEEDYLLGCVI